MLQPDNSRYFEFASLGIFFLSNTCIIEYFVQYNSKYFELHTFFRKYLYISTEIYHFCVCINRILIRKRKTNFVARLHFKARSFAFLLDPRTFKSQLKAKP